MFNKRQVIYFGGNDLELIAVIQKIIEQALQRKMAPVDVTPGDGAGRGFYRCFFHPIRSCPGWN